MEVAGFYFEGRGENAFSNGGVGVKRDITPQAVGVTSSGEGKGGGGDTVAVNGKVMCARVNRCTSHPPSLTSACQHSAPRAENRAFDHKTNEQNPQPHTCGLHLSPADPGHTSPPWAPGYLALPYSLSRLPSAFLSLALIGTAEPSVITLLPPLQIERRGLSDLRYQLVPGDGGGRHVPVSGTQCKNCDNRKDMRLHEDRITF